MTLPFDLSLFQIFFIASLIFVGSSVQGVLGFGFAVIASPIVVQIEPLLVPQLLSLLGLPLAIRIFVREKSRVDFGSVKPLIWGRLLGGPLGLYLLFLLSERYLSISVGGIVFFAGIASYFGWTINKTRINSLIAGTLSGVFGMIAAIGGPPVALLYRNSEPEEFRPSLNSVFTIGIIITLTLLTITGRIYIDHIYMFLINIPFVFLGIRLSSVLFSKISQKVIATSVTYFSIASGLYVILRNLI